MNKKSGYICNIWNVYLVVFPVFYCMNKIITVTRELSDSCEKHIGAVLLLCGWGRIKISCMVVFSKIDSELANTGQLLFSSSGASCSCLLLRYHDTKGGIHHKRLCLNVKSKAFKNSVFSRLQFIGISFVFVLFIDLCLKF